MSKPKTQFNRKANERVKLLISENKMSQRMFANSINYTEQHISKILSDKNPTPISLDTASRIAAVYSVRTEWVMGMDDYRTNEEYIDARLDRVQTVAEAVHSIIKSTYANENVEIKFYKKEAFEKFGVTMTEDCYALVCGGRIIGMIGLSEYLTLRQEILHYSAYLCINAKQKAERGLLNPIPLPEDLPNG